MLQIGSVVWGVNDVSRAMEFWTAALGYEPIYPPDFDWVLLGAPGEPGGPEVRLALQMVDSDASDRRRHHLDLYADDQTAEVARLVQLGATEVDWDYEENADYVVLADPEGNLFCVVDKGD